MRTEIVRANAALPKKSHPGDAGFDVTLAGDLPVALDWHTPKAVVPLGIRVEIPAGYELQVRPRSGLASRYGIMAVFGTIDSGYRGELMVTLLRVCTPDDEPVVLRPGDRIAQLVLAPVVGWAGFSPGVVTSDTDRGDRGHGSTGL